MAQQSVAAEQKTAPEEQPLVPPEERFWQRYSPHHEFPLSGAGSIALHALVLGALLFFALRATGDREENKPVQIAMVEIDGAEGNLDGLGLGSSLFKEEKRRPRTEAGVEGGGSANTTGNPNAPRPDPDALALKKPLARNELALPLGGEEPDFANKDEAFTKLDAAVRKVEHSIAMAANPSAKPGGKDRVDQKGGTGGRRGKGGTGLTGTNPGGGTSPYGRVLTNQQKRQMRWKILASEDGSIHLAKLKALGVTLVLPTRKEGVYKLMDLSRPSPTFETTQLLANQGGKVWWTNRDLRQVAGLAAVLRIGTPTCFVIFLPKSLEERMLELEREYQGRGENEIQMTVWDVPLLDGHYAREPKVVQQILRGGR